MYYHKEDHIWQKLWPSDGDWPLQNLAIGLLAIILQINLMGKGNLAPTSALDQLQNYVLGGIIGAIIYNDQNRYFTVYVSPHFMDYTCNDA